MAKFGKNIKKQVDAIDQQENSLKIIREKMKTSCCHNDKHGDPNVVPKKNSKQGDLKYLCKECRKDLCFKKIEENDMNAAIELLDRACDIIKLSLDLTREKDQAIHKKISKVQFILRNEIMKYYAAVIKKNKKDNKQKRNNNERSMWGNPTINGR